MEARKKFGNGWNWNWTSLVSWISRHVLCRHYKRSRSNLTTNLYRFIMQNCNVLTLLKDIADSQSNALRFISKQASRQAGALYCLHRHLGSCKLNIFILVPNTNNWTTPGLFGISFPLYIAEAGVTIDSWSCEVGYSFICLVPFEARDNSFNSCWALFLVLFKDCISDGVNRVELL